MSTGDAAVEHIPLAPSTGVWSVPSDDEDQITSLLGKDCRYDLAAVPVVILDEQGYEKEVEIVTDATSSCDPVRLVVTDNGVCREPVRQ